MNRAKLILACAIACGVLAAPAQAGKLAKSSRTVIRIDNDLQASQPAQRGGVRVATGDVNGDGTADGAPKPKPKPTPPPSAGGRKSPPSETMSLN
jgi:hypothetical protein